MRINIPYGKDEKQILNIPDENFAEIVYPKDVSVGDESLEIRRALESPVKGPTLEKFLEGGENIVFIVNDGTRPTPTCKVLDALDERLDLSEASYLVATGAHREPTEEEYRFIFGKHFDNLKDNIHSHDAHNDACVYLGTSKNGTEMHVNELVINADRLVVITSVEPHYFAGYTGGRKSFLPGVASYQTIEQNHRLAMRQEAQALVLENNPVHEDMIDALSIIGDRPIFGIQIVLDRHQNIYRVEAGDLHASFEAAVNHANEVFSVKIKEKTDIVVTVAPYPMDVDLYQSQKALDNGKWALKEGGTIIMVSKCREGIGHDTFLQQLSQSSDPRVILENLAKEYKLGYHKAAKMAEIAVWARMFTVTDLDPQLLRDANMIPYNTVQEAVDAALRDNPSAKVLISMDGSITIPRVD
ncbi:MAG: nickel-dependent lactate racemase [Euryarchaeota archaeon]|nr:nickel-dependent lactate racemase [Euryarchaeota archaeon]